MNTLRAFITALLLTSSIGPSWAGTSTITTKDASGVTKTFDVITDGSGNFGSITAICDGTAIANCVAVKAASTAAVAADPAIVARIADGGDVSLGAKADAHSCSSASAIACLGQIDDDVKGAIPAGTNRIGYASDDVCSQKAKTTQAFTTSSAGPVSIVALSGSTVIYICSISAISDTAIKLNFIDGTGGSCASAQHAIWGSTTAANGMSLAANGGFTAGSGNGTVGQTTAASAFCLLQSGTSLVAGNISYVQQ